MREPSVIRVLGHNIKVQYENLEDEELHGDYDPNTHTIRIDKNLLKSPDVLRLVIFHELTHVLESYFSIELTETQVCALSTAFIAIIVDNKELSEWAFGFPIKGNRKGVG
tara:strand:- start:1419 stop:1748 length:330 start_codon:yes stop_codon:yes gene_type:complete